jgi:hypothetical protein
MTKRIRRAGLLAALALVLAPTVPTEVGSLEYLSVHSKA